MGRNGTRGLSKPGARVLSLTAALALAATVFPAKAALARTDGQEVDALVAQAEEAAMAVQAGEAIPVTEDTHSMSSGTYLVKGTVTISPDETGNAIRVEPGSSVNLVLSVGSLLRVTGADAEGAGVGHAAILLPESSSLYVTGGGRMFATGGRAGDGCCGGDAEKPRQYYLREMYSDKYYYDMRVGEGGSGGQGGGGAGAGIGTDGGAGGAGGRGGNAIMSEIEFGGPTEAAKNHYGNDGYAGGAGSASAPAGTLTVMGDAKVVATGGAAAEAGGPGGRRGEYLANYGRYNAALFEVAGACGT
ncbi:MAG: hypothetical protein Q4C09_07725, partial [Atopobiaceae bacterium]|nr:hypothetical protein [Atopobiaceae bacterium]